MVMMNMMRSTSRTSINGVVFRSIIGSRSSRPPLIAIYVTPYKRCASGVAIRTRLGLGDEADLHETCHLHGEDRAANAAIRRVHVTTDVHFRKLEAGSIDAALLLDFLPELLHRLVDQFLAGDRGHAPENLALAAFGSDRKRDGLGLGGGRLARGL